MPASDTRDTREAAGAGARLAAVFVDVCLLAALDAMVIYLTMRICGLAFEELSVLPKVPLVLFLVIQNGAYLVAFTTGGQTLGKMAAGLRIVSTNPEAPVDVGRSVIRSAWWLVLALPAGLGLLPALFSRDGRGLHDRFAGTRVVRVSA
jgi:uncharacterized RDD family membrane protein YckC